MIFLAFTTNHLASDEPFIFCVRVTIMAFLIYLVYAVLTLILLYILSNIIKYRSDSKYFEKNGIPFLGMGLATIAKFFTGSITMVQAELDMYQECLKTKGAICGMSDIFGGLTLYIMDPDIIRNVFVKDFDHFSNRRSFGNPQNAKYISKMLFAMENEPWKGARAKLSPAFTTSKIKRMFQIFKSSSERMDSYLKEQMKPGEKSVDLNFLDIFPKYAMDVTAGAAFGIESKCFEVPLDKKSTFEKMGSRLNFGFKEMIKIMLGMMFPTLMLATGVDIMDNESQNYFAGIIRDVIKKRRQEGERREDFLQLMLDAQKGQLNDDEETSLVMNGSTEGSSLYRTDTQGNVVTFSDDEIVANAMLFMLAGFDTTQSVLHFALYSLALEQEVQQKVFEEVEKVKGKYGGEITYDAVLEMAYLDMVISESMRKYTPTPNTERACTKDYPVPGTNFVITKGTIVAISMFSIHQDPRYYPEPEKFIPERFSAEGKANRNPYVYMPFGHGPRNCIGMRFALIKVKTVIAHLVSKYRFAPCSQTKIPAVFDSSATLRPKGGNWINVTSRA